jgi:hypothetical protein
MSITAIHHLGGSTTFQKRYCSERHSHTKKALSIYIFNLFIRISGATSQGKTVCASNILFIETTLVQYTMAHIRSKMSTL